MQRNTISHKTKADRIVSAFPMQQQKNIRLIKKTNEIGEFYQVISQTHLGYDNAFLKIKLETTTKPNAKVHCKARVNDNYLECIQKMYDAGKIIHPEYKIDTERFNDENGQCHWNINFLSKPEEKMHTAFEKMKSIFDKISDAAKNTDNEDNEDNEHENDENDDASVVEPIAVPIAEPIAEPIAVPIANTMIDETISNANTNVNANTSDIQPTNDAPPAVQLPMMIQVPVHIPVPVPVYPQQFMPVFTEITVESLDAEKMHIYNFEMHINKMQKDLEFMKKQHEIRIKCYNEIVDLHNSNSNLEFQQDKTNVNPEEVILDVIPEKVAAEVADLEISAEDAEVEQTTSTTTPANIENSTTDFKSPIEGKTWFEVCTEEEEWDSK